MNAVPDRPNAAAFDVDAAIAAADAWGANCGPGAIAAILGKTLDEIRPHLGDFEKKRYTNPTLMLDILKRLGVTWTKKMFWPHYGLVRIQWEGPWTAPGVPMVARYRHTHWVGAQRMDPSFSLWIFDINAICVGGWIPYEEWSGQLVPWLLKECAPKANGKWHITHSLEIDRATGPTCHKGGVQRAD